MTRKLVISIDTEVDKDRRWRISEPPAFESVRAGVPGLLTPLFERHGAIPTYLLSPEILEDPPSLEVLAALGEAAELGTHLHGDLIDPGGRAAAELAGRDPDTVQRSYGRALEAEKLARLTQRFEDRLGYRPTAFRAGRYGIGEHSFELLAELGYAVDSSVTPHLLWRYGTETLDFREWTAQPRVLGTAAGDLVELPISIRPGGPLAAAAQAAPELVGRVAGRLLGRRARHLWLRPSWESGEALVDYVEAADERVLVLMFHSIEVIPGASPYCADRDDVDRLLAALDHLLAHCRRAGIEFSGMTAAAAEVAAAHV
jgi:hypothetical protein